MSLVPSLKVANSREQFLLRLTFFLPYLRLTVKIFQLLRLSTKFLAVLRLSVNPIETLIEAVRKATSSPGLFPQKLREKPWGRGCAKGVFERPPFNDKQL